jgi:hypothetical protein
MVRFRGRLPIDSFINYIICIVVPGIFLVYSFLVIRLWHRIRLDLEANQAHSTAGEIQLRRKAGRGVSYHLTINSLEFDISKQLYNKFVDGENYRIYYAPNSIILLSAEQL